MGHYLVYNCLTSKQEITITDIGNHDAVEGRGRGAPHVNTIGRDRNNQQSHGDLGGQLQGLPVDVIAVTMNDNLI